MSDTTGALIASLSFGLVVLAALGTVIYHITGGVSTFFRVGLRLVLLSSLLLATLWALIAFGSTFINSNAPTGCQVAIIFSSSFDQLARVTLEEFLFWAIKSEFKPTFGVLFPQAIIFVRAILGAILVGIQRPQFDPVCVTTTLVWPVGVTVLVFDAFILVMLLTRASYAGILCDMRIKGPGGKRPKGIVSTTIASGIWIPLSVPMIVGIDTLSIALRSALPAVGVLLVIASIAYFYKSFVWSRRDAGQKSDEFVKNFPGLSETALVSPSVEEAARRGDRPVEPVGSARDAPSRPGQDTSIPRSAPAERTQVSGDDVNALPIIRQAGPGPSAAGVGGLPVKGELFPPTKIGPVPNQPAEPPSQSVKKPSVKGSKLVISYPILQEDTLTDDSPFKRIATVDLNVAAQRDKERRMKAEQQSLTAPINMSTLPPPRPPPPRGQTIDRKGVATAVSRQPPIQIPTPALEHSAQGAPSSKPGPPLMMPAATGSCQGSPRHISQLMRTEARQVSPKVIPPPRPRRDSGDPPPPPIPPRSPMRPSAELSPGLWPIIKQSPSVDRFPKRPNLNIAKEHDKAASPASAVSVTNTVSANVMLESQLPENKSKASASKAPEVLVPPVPPLFAKTPQAQALYASGDSLSGQSSMTTVLPVSRNGSVKNDIRPSRQIPPTNTQQDEARGAKTPAQLRKAAGLPSHPRVRAANEAEGKKTAGTIVFSNETSSEGTPKHSPKNRVRQADRKPSVDHDSVVNRPRPVPRRKSSDSFSDEEADESRESPRTFAKSPIMTSRNKAFINNAPGAGSSQAHFAPPVPPLPSSAPMSPWPTVMTSDNVASATLHLNASEVQHDGSKLGNESRATTEPTAPEIVLPRFAQNKSNPRMMPNLTVSAVPGHQHKEAARNMSKFSIASTISPREEWPAVSLHSPMQAVPQQSQAEPTIRSSPTPPRGDLQGSAASAPAQSSLDSRALPQNRPILTLAIPSLPESSSVRSSFADEDDGKEFVTVMLDRSTDFPARSIDTPPFNRIYGGIRGRRGSWHRRVGENCPTFSDRNAAQSRRLPRPPPLDLLNVTRRFKEPPPEAPPLETPHHALDMIQEQLKKFEQPDSNDDESNQQRMALLADLEMEMGAQENQWQKMQVDLSRASFSTLASNSNTPAASAHNSPLPSRLMQPQKSDNSGNVYGSEVRKQEEAQIKRLTEMLTASTQDGHAAGFSPRRFDERAVESNPSPEQVLISDAVQPDRRDLATSREPDLWHHDGQEEDSLHLDSQAAQLNTPSEIVFLPIPTEVEGVGRAPWKTSEPAAPIDEEEDDDVAWPRPNQTGQPQSRSPGLWKERSRPPTDPANNRRAPPRPRTFRPPRKTGRISNLPDIVESPEPLDDRRGTLGIFQYPWGEKSDTATLPVRLPSQSASDMYMNVDLGAISETQTESAASFFDYYDDDDKAENASEDPENEMVDDDNDDDNDRWKGASENSEDVMVQDRDDRIEEAFEDSEDEMVNDGDGNSLTENTLSAIAAFLGSDNVPSRESLFLTQRDGEPADSSSRQVNGDRPDASRDPSKGAGNQEKGRMADERFVQTSAMRREQPSSFKPHGTTPQERVANQVETRSSTSAGQVDDELPSVTGEILLAFTQTGHSNPGSFIGGSRPNTAKPLATLASQGSNDGRAQPSANLWVPPTTQPRTETASGLFQSQRDAAQSRREAFQDAAASKTRPSIRPSNSTLVALESTSLWAPPVEQTPTHDWVTLSSVRPSTPPGQPSSSDSEGESAFSETSSSFSSVTGESTVGSIHTGQSAAQQKTRTDEKVIPSEKQVMTQSQYEMQGFI